MSKENKLELKPISVHEASKGALEAEIDRLRTTLSNADEEIRALSEQRDDALAYVTSLKEDAVKTATIRQD